MEVTLEQGLSAVPDKLAMFRAQIRAEAESKPKMSEQTAARLKEINEHDRTEKIANDKFVEWFNSKTVTVEFLMDCLYRISRDENHRLRGMRGGV